MRTKLLLLLICFYLISCKKENDVVPTVPAVNNDNIGDSIIFGNTSNLLLLSYTSSFGNVFDIDFDNQGLPDIRIQDTYYGSPAHGYHGCKIITCYNPDCKISGTIREDTSFYYKIIGKKTEDHFRSCQRIIPLPFVDSLISIDSSVNIYSAFIKKYGNFGDVLNKNDIFKSDSSFLSEQNYSYSNSYNSVMITNHYYFSCDEFPSDVIKYIGVNVKLSGIEKLGWIKLIVNSNNYSRITILEVAIQK